MCISGRVAQCKWSVCAWLTQQPERGTHAGGPQHQTPRPDLGGRLAAVLLAHGPHGRNQGLNLANLLSIDGAAWARGLRAVWCVLAGEQALLAGEAELEGLKGSRRLNTRRQG
jgi:hypothetical protein